MIEVKSFTHGQRTGTVLFERKDYGKQCWTSDEFTILNSRRMFQDILPNVRPIETVFKKFHQCSVLKKQYFIINKKFKRLDS